MIGKYICIKESDNVYLVLDKVVENGSTRYMLSDTDGNIRVVKIHSVKMVFDLKPPK